MMNLSDETQAPAPAPDRARSRARAWAWNALGAGVIFTALILPWMQAWQIRELQERLGYLDGYATTTLNLHHEGLKVHGEAILVMLKHRKEEQLLRELERRASLPDSQPEPSRRWMMTRSEPGR